MSFAGVFAKDVPTSVVPPVRTKNPVVAIGTSQKLPNPNEPKLIFTFDEYVNIFGYTGNYDVHTLDEVADVAFKLYKVAPVVFISIGTDATDTTNTFTPTNLINAISQWIDKIFYLFRMVPGILIIPKGSENPSVALAMASNTEIVSSLFKAIAIADIPDSVQPSNVPNYKNTNNLVDDNLILTYPSLELDRKKYHLSTHIAMQQALLDAKHDAPYVLASNQNLVAQKAKYNLTLEEANYLRGNGVVTALNFIGGLVSWGDRTSIYPASTDPVEAQIVVRRMHNFLREVLIRTYWRYVDKPLGERLLKTIRDSVQSFLNGLKSRGIIIDGEIYFRPDENPITDLSDGIVRFHINWMPPVATRKIEFLIEFDPRMAESLFKAVGGVQ